MSNTTVGTTQILQVFGGTLRLANGTGPTFSIGSDPFTIGRNEQCSLPLVHDRKVSTFHAELVATPTGVRLRDLGSRNGTYADSNRCVEVYLLRPVRLQFGDSIYLFTPGPAQPVEVGAAESFGQLVGATQVMRNLFGLLRKVAASDFTALITGETGTGKELVARAIHAHSARAKGPYVVIDCAAIPASLAESALFGHERGAFTGATDKHISPFRRAEGGTVFLDEIGELPAELQPKFLRVMQERTVQPVGSDQYYPVNVRVIAATRRDLRRQANSGAFRDDLYHRLSMLPVAVPELRDRADDIPLFMSHFARTMGFEAIAHRISPESVARFIRYEWPGNVRELVNVLVRGLALADGHGPIELYPGTGDVTAASDQVQAHEIAMADFDLKYWRGLWVLCNRNVAQMVRLSGRSRPTVQKYLDRFQLHGTDA